MSTLLIKTDDTSSAKLLLALAKKMRFKARLLNEEEREDMALLSLMEKRRNEPSLPVETAYKILKKVK